MLFAENTLGQNLVLLMWVGVMLIGFVRLLKMIGGNSPVAVAGRRAAANRILRTLK